VMLLRPPLHHLARSLLGEGNTADDEC
jgi:hypothetical protein